MKKFTLSFTLFHFALIVLGQVEGSVIDLGNEPVPFANVVLFHAQDTTLVSGTMTDDFGKFELTAEVSGEFLVRVTNLGYAEYFSQPFLLNAEKNRMDLGAIILAEEVSQLDEVVLTTKKNLIQSIPEGQVINVQSSVMTKGSNALQLLERLPGVILDKRDSQFTLNGQSGVTVLLNGRNMNMSMEDVMTLLEGTLADQIEKVELITAPTAKYDADGGAGLINIVFKKNAFEGNQLNINTSVGYGYWEKASSSANYSYGTEKLNLNVTYSVFHDHRKNGFEGLGTSNMPILGAPSQTSFATYFNTNNNSHNLNFGLGYQMSPKTEVGGEFVLAVTKDRTLSDVNNDRNIEGQDFLSTQLLSEGTTDKTNFMSSIYMGTALSENSNLNVDLSYLTYTNDGPTTTQSQYFDENGVEVIPENEIFTDGNRGFSESTIQLGVVKADYDIQVHENLGLEFGLKGSYSINSNDSRIETNMGGIWEVDPRSQSLIESDEVLWASYAQFNLSLGKKSKINGGVRYEDWKRTLTTAEDDFVIQQFFPSFSYRYSLSENQHLSFNFHKRISRPSYTDLVASLYYNDPTAIFTGNPLLKPSITNTVGLEYGKGGFNMGLRYQRETNPIIRYQLTSTSQNDILIISPQNADYQNSLGLFLNIPVQWASWAKLNVSSTSALRKYQISYSPSMAEKSYFFQSLNFNQNIKLPWEMDMEFSGWYNFDHYNGTNFTEGFGIVNFGLSKTLKKNKGTLQLSVTDIFKSFDVYTDIGGMTPIVFDIGARSWYRDESAFTPVFRLTYSRTFGGNSNKKSRGIDQNEEFGRVN